MYHNHFVGITKFVHSLLHSMIHKGRKKLRAIKSPSNLVTLAVEYVN